ALLRRRTPRSGSHAARSAVSGTRFASSAFLPYSRPRTAIVLHSAIVRREHQPAPEDRPLAERQESFLRHAVPFHLSIPVADLDEARSFYESVLGAHTGRVTPDWLDVILF